MFEFISPSIIKFKNNGCYIKGLNFIRLAFPPPAVRIIRLTNYLKSERVHEGKKEEEEDEKGKKSK